VKHIVSIKTSLLTHLIRLLKLCLPLEQQGKSTLLTAIDGRAVAVIGFSSPLKPTALQTIQQMKELGVVMVVYYTDYRRCENGFAKW
jgi:cation transport ATPase